MMDLEIRFRVTAAMHTALSDAAARRGVPVTSLVAMAAYEYLRERSELTPTPADEAKPVPTRASLPSKETLAAWEDDDEDD